MEVASYGQASLSNAYGTLVPESDALFGVIVVGLVAVCILGSRYAGKHVLQWYQDRPSPENDGQHRTGETTSATEGDRPGEPSRADGSGVTLTRSSPRVAIRSLSLNRTVRGAVLTVAIVSVLVVGEVLLFYGNPVDTLFVYVGLIFALSLLPLVTEEHTPLVQAFVLLPVFRIVNFGMPVFTDLTLFWLPIVYAPFILVFAYLGRQVFRGTPEVAEVGRELPWWLGGESGGKLRTTFEFVVSVVGTRPDEGATAVSRVFHWLSRGVFLVLIVVGAVCFLPLMFVLTVYLAEIEYGIATPAPLIPSMEPSQIVVLLTVMVVLVGFVEELLFRGLLQRVLERRFGLFPGLLLASGIFGLMHSGYGLPLMMVSAGVVGLVFGIVYDLTDSLVLVSVMHGVLNVFLFGIIPLDGTSSLDLLESFALEWIQRSGLAHAVTTLQALDLTLIVGFS